MTRGRAVRGFGRGAGHHRRPIAIAIGFGFFLLVGLVLLLTYPLTLAEADRYAHAVACISATEAASRNTTCTYAIPARIDRTYVRYGSRGGPHQMAVVNLPDGSRRVVEAGRRNAVYDALRPGQQVQLEIWRMRIAKVSTANGGTIQTTDNPDFNKSDRLVLGVAITGFGALGCWIAYRAYKRTGSWTQPEASLDLGGSPESTLAVAVGFFALCAGIIAYGYFQVSAEATFLISVGTATVLASLIVLRLVKRGIPAGWRTR